VKRVSYLILTGAIIAGFINTPPAVAADATATDSAAVAAGAPVVVDRDTLFYVTSRVLSFTPEDRAKAIGERLHRLIDDELVTPQAITVQEAEGGSEIHCRDIIVMTVTDADARSAGVGRAELANTIAARIRREFGVVRERYSLRKYLLAALYSVLTIGVVIFIFWGLRRLFFRLYDTLHRWKGTRIPTLKIQKLEILTAERTTLALLKIAKALRLILTALLLYVGGSLVLGYFPQTRLVSAYVLSRSVDLIRPLASAVINYLPNLAVIAVVLAVAYYAIKLVRFFFEAIRGGYLALPGFYAEWADTTYKIIRFALIVLFVVILFPYLPGSDSPAFKGVSIFIGLLFSLGSTSVVANVVAGIILTYMRPFRVGDRVKISDTVGDVMEKTVLVTRVRTIKNVVITIPNAMVLSSHIINYSLSGREEPLVLHTSVTIGYNAPWRHVHELLVSAAAATEHILKQPKPYVLQLALDDFFVEYELNAYTDNAAAMARTYSDLHQNIQDMFGAAGVEIMSPHYRAIRDGGASTVPADSPTREQ
jgi:small-conductance mechanosensitive channel